MLLDKELKDNLININQHNVDNKIYRVFRMTHFKDMISSGKLVLINPSHWDDPFENFVLKTNVVDKGGTTSLENLYKQWYGQCWTDNGEETDALWRIYSPEKDGIRVATTIRKLVDIFFDRSDQYWKLKYFLGKVEYDTRENIETFINNTTFMDITKGGSNTTLANLFCVKRIEFKHEQEIRIIFCDIRHCNIEENKGLYRIPIDYTTLLDDILVDPRMEQCKFEELKHFIKNEGLATPISQSELYKIDLAPIRLAPGS